MAGAARRNETAIGLKSALLAEPGLKFGVVVNPPKSQTYTIAAGRRGRGAAAARPTERPRRAARWDDVLVGDVWLVRHGATEWSVSGRHTSTTELPLTAEGEDAARSLAPRLAEATFALVLTSPRERARRTAELAGFATAEVDEDLAEWAYGSYEGITTDEIRESVPGWTVWTHPCPGGETADQVSARLDRVVARCRAADGDALLFGHAHALRALTARWLRAAGLRGPAAPPGHRDHLAARPRARGRRWC